MRRDVWRVGLGRFLFEGALGLVLALPVDERERVIAMVLALGAAVAVHALVTKRRAFVAANLAMAAAALPGHLDPRLGTLGLALGLGAAIELSHVDLVDRRRLAESVRSLRIPSSLLVRRLGSAVVVAGIGRAMLPVAAMAARPTGLAPLFVVVGAFAMLSAGFGAGPGRPVTRPIDAAVFVLLGIVLAIPT